MSSTVTPDLQDRVQTITDAFEAFDESKVAAGGVPTFEFEQNDVENQLERLCAYRVPIDEAVRTLVRKACADADLERAGLSEDIARLAGYGGRSRGFSQTMLADVDEADQWIDVVAEVVELWEPRSEKIAQVGLLGDESGRLKFVKWANDSRPRTCRRPWGEYRCENALSGRKQSGVDLLSMETRKVQKVGGGTYTVSIPVHWADEYDIEAGVTVYLYTHLDGSLVVRRREKEYSELAAVDIELNNHDPSVTERVLRAAYTAGFKRITLKASDEFTQGQQRVINSTIRDLTGVEIAEQTDTRTTVQGLLDARDVSIRQSILQLRFITLAMHEAAMAAFTGDTEEVEYIFQRDSEADRVYELISRQFSRSLVDFEELDQLGLTRSELFRYFLTARQLERVADHAAKIAGVVHRMNAECSIDNELLEEVAALAEDSRQVVESASDVVVNQSSIEQAHDALDLRDNVVERASEIDDLLIDEAPSEAYPLTRILDRVIRTSKYGGNIAEIAIQSSLLSPSDRNSSSLERPYRS